MVTQRRPSNGELWPWWRGYGGWGADDRAVVGTMTVKGFRRTALPSSTASGRANNRELTTGTSEGS